MHGLWLAGPQDVFPRGVRLDLITGFQLGINALISGLLLGGFYASVSVGIAISFGMLDIANISHPAMIMLGSFLAYVFNAHWGIDPLITMLMLAPLFGLFGMGVYSTYHGLFESREKDPRRGLAFFFGLLFVTDVALILIFGVDLRGVETPYADQMMQWGFVEIPLRLLLPFLIGVLLILGMELFMQHTYFGLSVSAVTQDPVGLRLMGIDPIKIKKITFGLSVATAAMGGAALIIIQPVEPAMGREYIGRVFAVSVLGGMGSLTGSLLAAMLLGVAESLTSTFIGPSWSPAVAFSILLLTLAMRPSGLMGKR